MVIVKDQYSSLVYPNMHKITNLWESFDSIGHWRSMQENNERKNTLVAWICVLSERLKHFNISVRNYFRGSHCSQCVCFHLLVPSMFLCYQLFWVVTNSVQCHSTWQENTKDPSWCLVVCRPPLKDPKTIFFNTFLYGNLTSVWRHHFFIWYEVI